MYLGGIWQHNIICYFVFTRNWPSQSLSVTCGRGRCIFPGIPVSSNNKTDHHDITEILLKVALSTTTIILDHYRLNFRFIIGNFSNSAKQINICCLTVVCNIKYAYPSSVLTVTRAFYRENQVWYKRLQKHYSSPLIYGIAIHIGCENRLCSQI